MSAGERIKAARKRKGWTQNDLAEAVHCSQQTIVDVERQEQPTSRFLSAIVRALDENLDYIETGIGSPASVQDEENNLPHYDMETIALRALDSSYADNVIDYLYSAPLKLSRAAYTVGVDRSTSQLMNASTRLDDVLFVDPFTPVEPGRLVLVVMPGWRRAEVRELTNIAGDYYLEFEGDAPGNRAIACKPYAARDDYNAHDDESLPPAMICGTVCFIGRET